MAETQAGTFKIDDAAELHAGFVTFKQAFGEQLSNIYKRY
jgi:hypothetical protein